MNEDSFTDYQLCDRHEKRVMKLQRLNDITDYQHCDRHDGGNINREKDITDYQLSDRRENETSKVG